MTNPALKVGQLSEDKSNNKQENFKMSEPNNGIAICNDEENDYVLNDLIGPFGIYQMLVMIFSALREVVTSIDQVSPSLVLPLDDTYRCAINETQGQRYLDVQKETEYDPRCYCMNTVNTTVVACTEWTFQDKYKNTMMAEWNLVCDRQYLTPLVHSSFFVGLVLGNMLWGPLADKIGRWNTYSVGHIAYLIFGTAAVFAPNIYWFLVFRFFAGFNAVSYYVLPTLQVEMIATEYRSFSSTMNHIGWGLGIILVPFFGHYIHKWRYIIAITPIANAISLPYLLVLPESIRWLILDGQMDRARKEIKRAANLNRQNIVDMDRKIDKFFAAKKLSQRDCLETQGSITKLFTNKTLFKCLITLSVAIFMMMYIYYSRTLHFAPDETSMFANFIITGTCEWICLIISATCMYYLPRKTCMSAFLVITSVSLFVEAFAHKALDYVWPTFYFAIDAFIKLFNMCALMVTLLVIVEIFPTELRQSGITIVKIIGDIGVVISPYHFDIQQMMGLVSYTFSMASLIMLIAVSIKHFLTETGKSDILDSVKG